MLLTDIGGIVKKTDKALKGKYCFGNRLVLCIAIIMSSITVFNPKAKWVKDANGNLSLSSEME